MTNSRIALLFSFCSLSIFLAQSSAQARAIMERRIWIEDGVKLIAKEQCKDSVKQWRCAIDDRIACEKAMAGVSKNCGDKILPDLPEYIDGEETEARARKVVIDCLSLEFSKKYLIGQPKEKMDEYNYCTGLIPRPKVLPPFMQKALDYSKNQLTFTCDGAGFIRKCFSVSDSDCNGLISKSQTDCLDKMTAEGVLAKDDAGSTEVGRRLTDCTLAEAKKSVAANKSRSKDKDCN